MNVQNQIVQLLSLPYNYQYENEDIIVDYVEMSFVTVIVINELF